MIAGGIGQYENGRCAAYQRYKPGVQVGLWKQHHVPAPFPDWAAVNQKAAAVEAQHLCVVCKAILTKPLLPGYPEDNENS